ncbi:hypothetical protein M569_14378 [Genlisea aurea]|uniref:Retrotransposon Copia-like N-terminal domain-containing protein n=1 Tax=Genlisea aurea TaxID=192259 RepID=S8DLL0_9LAMI|nr:hypothetical protein M569_14378 [Genlisea aurea]
MANSALSSSLNVSNFISSKLNNSNFFQWKEMAIGLAESQGLSDHLTGEIPAPPKYIEPSPTDNTAAVRTISAEYTQWRSSDRLLRSWLLSTISDETWPLIVGCDSVAALWKALENAFEQKSDERRFALRHQLFQMRKRSDQSLDDYLLKFKSLLDNLAKIGDVVPDGEQLQSFESRRKLNEEYEQRSHNFAENPMGFFSQRSQPKSSKFSSVNR